MTEFFQNLWFISSAILPQLARGNSGLGDVAVNLLEPVTVLSGFVQSACFAIGGAFILASIVKYFEYKRSPLMVPISTVIFLFVMGVLLILLPFASYLTNTGIN